MTWSRLSRAEAVLLSILLDELGPARQVQLAAATGITQARVSQILAEFDRHGWTERSAPGWQVRDPEALFDILAAARAPKIETVDAWYNLDSAPRQIESAIEQAEQQGVTLRVCGDWAADRLSPWRIPDRVVLHCDAFLDLEPANFVPTDHVPAATALVTSGPLPPGWRLDRDIAVAMGGRQASAWPLAPVTEVAREMLATGAPDSADAVAELKQRFLTVRRELTGAA